MLSTVNAIKGTPPLSGVYVPMFVGVCARTVFWVKRTGEITEQASVSFLPFKERYWDLCVSLVGYQQFLTNLSMFNENLVKMQERN